MSEPNKKLVLPWMSPRKKVSVLPFLAPVLDSNGHSTNTATHHKLASKKTTRSSWSVAIRANQNKKDLCVTQKCFGGGEKHPTATRNMKRINNHQYAIMKKQLLSDLCVPHSPCVEGPLNHPKSVTDVQSCLKCKLIVTFLVLPDLNTKQILSVL